MEFSDESDTEVANAPETKSDNKRSMSSAPKPTSKSRAEEQNRPRRTRTMKKSTALCPSGASSEEDTQPRRGRSRKAQSSDDVEKPEKMRMSREDECGDGLDISLEDLQETDSEMNAGACLRARAGVYRHVKSMSFMYMYLCLSDADCEVLRRDLGVDPTRDCVKELKSSGQTGIPMPHTHVTPGE